MDAWYIGKIDQIHIMFSFYTNLVCIRYEKVGGFNLRYVSEITILTFTIYMSLITALTFSPFLGFHPLIHELRAYFHRYNTESSHRTGWQDVLYNLIRSHAAVPRLNGSKLCYVCRKTMTSFCGHVNVLKFGYGAWNSFAIVYRDPRGRLDRLMLTETVV